MKISLKYVLHFIKFKILNLLYLKMCGSIELHKSSVHLLLRHELL